MLITFCILKDGLDVYYMPSTILRILHVLFLLYNDHHHLLRAYSPLGAIADDL